MLRWNPKSVIVAASLLLMNCVGLVHIAWAQNQAPAPAVNLPESYYEKPDLRKPVAHPESSVLRRTATASPADYQGSQGDYIQQQYQAMLSQHKQTRASRASANRPLSTGSATESGNSSAYIGSYRFEGNADRYVPKPLPSRLIPPDQPTFKRQQVTGSFSLKSNGPDLSAPSTPDRRQYQARPMPTQPNPTSYKRRPMPQQSQEQLYLNGQFYDSPNRVPPIVTPADVPGAISRPVYYSHPNYQPVQRTARSAARPAVNSIRRNPVRPTSNQSRDVIKGTTRIPTGFSSESSMVARARILIQDSGDPFGQGPDLSGQRQDGQSSDPFGESPDDGSQNPEGSFETPPTDIERNDQDFQRPAETGGDPFADPPSDFQSQQERGDPFGEEPSRIREVDPSPALPNDINPNESIRLPQDNREQSMPNEAPVPRDDPRRVRNRNRNRTDLPKGPFKQGNFIPTPIQPAPARREFQEIIVPPLSGSVAPEYYDQADIYNGPDQPTYFESGTEFNKGDLYEGISVPRQRQIGNSGYDELFHRRPRLVDRFNLGASRLATNIACGSCGFDCGGNCDAQRVGQDIWNDGACFEPSYYVSLFGGYTQMEAVAIPSSTLVGGPALASDRFTFNGGFGVGMAFGQIQGENLRSEIEFAFRHNDGDQVLAAGVNTISETDLDGSAQVYTGMFNMIWDFQPRPIFGRNRPYAGAGIGFAVIDIDSSPINPLSALENQTSFAYQWIAGISRPVSFRSDAFVEYRYLNADSIFADSASGPFEFDYATDNIFFGLRAYF